MKVKIDSVQNQKGAALILILFVVVFLGIVGSILLNTTTYSMKTLISNKVEQHEFYKAEGALEIAIEEMLNYGTGDETGPFYYLFDGLTDDSLNERLEKSYVIGGENYRVKIKFTGVLQPLSNYTSEEIIHVEMEAFHSLDPKIKRTANFNLFIDVEETIISPDIPTINPFSGNALNHRNQIANDLHQNTNDYIPGDKKNRITNYEFDYLFNNTLGFKDVEFFGAPSYSSSFTFHPNEEKYIVKDVDYSGKDNLLTVENGASVYIETISLGGQGKSNASLNVKGILVVKNLNLNANSNTIVDGVIIAENIDIRGSGTLTINSGVITNRLTTNASASTLTGDANGINCIALNLDCYVPPISSGDPNNGSESLYNREILEVIPRQISFATKR